jgi:hypothetical protein
VFKTSRKYRLSIEEINLDYIDKKNTLLKEYNPGNSKEWQRFKKTTNVKKDTQLTHTEYRKIVNAIFKATKSLMFKHEGGVFLERYGYFSLLIIPFRNRGLKISKYYYDNLEHTDGYRYVPILDSDTTTKSCINKMIMDRSYAQKTKAEFWRLIIEEGFRPKNFYTAIKSMFGHGNAKIR